MKIEIGESLSCSWLRHVRKWSKAWPLADAHLVARHSELLRQAHRLRPPGGDYSSSSGAQNASMNSSG